MAIASIIVSLFGLVMSFILGFPLSYLIGPYVGIVIGAVGLVLGIVSIVRKRSNVTLAALIIGIAVVLICLFRIIAMFSLIGGIAGLIAG